MQDSFSLRSLARFRPRRSTGRLHFLMFFVSCLLLTGGIVVAYALDAFHRTELSTVDIRFHIRGQQPQPRDIAIVAIDDTTFNQLNTRWPFPRVMHARVIDALRKAGAAAIAYDVQFTEPTDPKDDNALIDSVARAHGKIVLATTQVNAKGHTNVLGGDSLLRQIGARPANALLPNDPGGVLRRVPYEVAGLKSFAVVSTEVATHKPVRRSKFPGRTAWIDYRGKPGTFETVSFSRVMNGQFNPNDFRGKIVVVGPTQIALQDVHPTSVGGSSLMSGAEVQANAISTVLRGLPLRETPHFLTYVLIVLMGLVGPVGAWRLGAIRSTLIALAVAAGYAVAVQLAFDSGQILSFVYPMSSLVLGAVAALAVGLTIQAFERERVRDLFARFVPESVVDEVLASTKGELRLGGETRTVTVLFSDIRGFTTYAETRPPDEVIEVLNRYLGAMSDVVLENGGTLVSYMGDGIMAVFGAPTDQPDHADRALATARQMSGPVLDDFNEWVRATGVGDGFRIGIGLNSGPVMAGNVGSQRRLEYTTIGDTTNTAARLEGMTKGTPHMIFIADSTRAALVGQQPDLVRVAEMDVRGRSVKVTVWSVGENGQVQSANGSAPAGEEAAGETGAEPEAAAPA